MKSTAAPRRILILQGHPDGTRTHLCHDLAEAYATGARSGGHEVRMLSIAKIDFPLLRSKSEWEHGVLPESLTEAQQAFAWAEHLVLVFPLWLGDMPALVKAFLEQVMRPGFALGLPDGSHMASKLLKGRSARVVVTMGMPAFVYRWYFRAHSVRALERNVLGFVGFAPVHETLIGMVENLSDKHARGWLTKLGALGREGL